MKLTGSQTISQEIISPDAFMITRSLIATVTSGCASNTFKNFSTLSGRHISSWSVRKMISPLASSRARPNDCTIPQFCSWRTMRMRLSSKFLMMEIVLSSDASSTITRSSCSPNCGRIDAICSAMKFAPLRTAMQTDTLTDPDHSYSRRATLTLLNTAVLIIRRTLIWTNERDPLITLFALEIETLCL